MARLSPVPSSGQSRSEGKASTTTRKTSFSPSRSFVGKKNRSWVKKKNVRFSSCDGASLFSLHACYWTEKEVIGVSTRRSPFGKRWSAPLEAVQDGKKSRRGGRMNRGQKGHVKTSLCTFFPIVWPWHHEQKGGENKRAFIFVGDKWSILLYPGINISWIIWDSMSYEHRLSLFHPRSHWTAKKVPSRIAY